MASPTLAAPSYTSYATTPLLSVAAVHVSVTLLVVEVNARFVTLDGAWVSGPSSVVNVVAADSGEMLPAASFARIVTE